MKTNLKIQTTMALNNVILMELCRLCQCQFGKIPFECNKELIKKVVEITRIEVTDELNIYLPTCICISCQDKILDTYNFIHTVQTIDKNLRNVIKRRHKLEITENTLDVEASKEKLEELKCEKCPATFADENLMNIHNNSHQSTSANFKCPVCFKLYNRAASYNSHKKRHKELCCIECNVVFDDVKEHKIHKCENTLSGKKEDGLKRKEFKFVSKAQCNICNKKFNSKNNLQLHLKIHKNDIFNEENDCKKLPPASLETHQLNHLGKRSFLCVTCGKSFARKNSLTCHEKIHSDIKGYRCDICNIGFFVRSNLRAHIKKYHEGVRFYCSQCTKEFLTKTGLNRHEKIHVGVKEFKCEKCTSAFYTKKELSKHQIYHQGLKLHKCEECFKTFFERHHLIIHLRSHSGERPYVCKIPGCGKSFAESQKLKRHHKAKHNAKS